MSEQSKESSSYLNIFEEEDPEKLAKAIEGYFTKDTNSKQALSFHWQRNQLMVDGQQWIYYDRQSSSGTGTWRPVPTTSSNEWVPRPVTNYMFDSYQTLKSYLVQNRPQISVEPNTQLWSDKEAAKLSTIVSEATWVRLKENQNYEYAASCGVMYGTVFKKDYWDPNTIQMAEIPKADMGLAPTPEDPSDIISIPVGDVNTTIVEPFRLALDPLCTDLHTARWVLEYSIQPLSWVKTNYGKSGEGYTGAALELEPDTKLNSSLERFTRLKNSSGIPNSYAGAADDSSTVPPDSVILKEYYEKPTQKSPRGRMIIVAGGKTLYINESPYIGDDSGDWHPYSEFRWEIVPGRFWGKSPLDSVAELNKRINSIDSSVILSRKTMASPQWVASKDAGINPGSITGKPGQVHLKRAGSELTKMPGVGMDSSVFKEREQSKNDIDLISGAMNILKGDKPGSITAASALEMLFEVGLGKLRPSLDRWKWFIESSQRKQLKLIHQNYKEKRPAFIKLLRSKNKELSDDAINSFLGENLDDNISVIIEAGSHIPKLQSSQRALLLEMAGRGVLNLEDPTNRSEFNKRFGLVGFDSDVGPDVARASWENDLIEQILQSADNRPFVLMDENHDIHLRSHWDRVKSPKFKNMPPEVQNEYMQHINEHNAMKAQLMQQQLVTQAMSGMPQPQPGQGQQQHQELPGKTGSSGHQMSKDVSSQILGPQQKII